MRVHIYARVSTDAQAEKGYSLPTQLEACRGKAEEMGATSIVEHIDDGYSGDDIDRPAFTRLREALTAKEVDIIVCFDPDRFSRNPGHSYIVMEEIELAGATLEFITVKYDKTPDGQFMFDVRGAMSKLERGKILERTMRGKRGKASKGKIVMNTKPTGYGWDSEKSMYVPNEDADLIRRMFAMAREGMSVSSITKQLNKEGIPSPKGFFWQPSTISRILHNTLYCGEARLFRQERRKIRGKRVTKIRNEAEWLIVPCPAIVSREEFEKVQNQVAMQKRFSPRNTRRVYLLQHIAKCGICGKPMYVALHGTKRHYYVCSSQRRRSQTGEGGCSNRGIPVDFLDEQVWAYLCEIALSPDAVRRQLAKRELRTNAASKVEMLRKTEGDLLSKQEKVMAFFTRGRIDEAQADKSLKDVQKQLQEVRSEIAKYNSFTGGKSIEQRVQNFLDAIRNIDNRRDACLRALSEVRVVRTDKNRGRWAKVNADLDIILR